jgi:ParB/RepB/Spo0J family partition protein
MQLEFHQLDRRWEHLRVRHPARQRRLLASLADSGQQTPIVVVAADGQPDRYVVIDGYKRIAALEQLGRDTVEAVVWPMREAAAVVLDRSLRLSERETALEVGWLLAELEQRFGYSLEELACRFDRSVSWVSRRLALVEVLPEAIQQQVREGQILAPVALKFLVPVARQSLEDCQRMAAIFAQQHCDTREAGQLYSAWRKGSPAIRKIPNASFLLRAAGEEEFRPFFALRGRAHAGLFRRPKSSCFGAEFSPVGYNFSPVRQRRHQGCFLRIAGKVASSTEQALHSEIIMGSSAPDCSKPRRDGIPVSARISSRIAQSHSRRKHPRGQGF